MLIGCIVFIIGLSLYIVNKMTKCSSYAAGYLGVIIQGIGIGLIIVDFIDYGTLIMECEL